ncbi:MAG: hypothetical protein AAF787_11655 [Chloroflexota bacterium]
MFERINTLLNGPDIPKLYIAQRVIDKMAKAAQQYIEDETGEAMIGMIIPDETSGTAVYILDTIAPGDDAVRETHTFQQGSVWQDEVLHWLRQNWEITRKKRAGSYGNSHAARWDAPLYHIGDWHKQPGFMIQPSGGDLMTALEWVNQKGNRIGFVIAPILTIDHPATVEDPDEAANFVRVEQEDGLMTRIDFWFIARKMMSFAPLTPNIVEDRIFPRLMGYPWHLTNEVRASQEIALLEGDGMLVEMILWDSDEQLPLEVGFLTARPGATHFLFIATQHNYPHSPPDIYTLPFASIQPDEDLYDLMERIWTHAELVEDPDDWEWNTGKTLLEYIYVAENMLGWNTSELPTTPEGELEAENVADSPAPVTEPDADTDTDNEKDSEADSA